MTPALNSRRFLFGIAGGIVLLGLLVAAKPAYRAVKTWRAGRLLASAEQQVAKGNWPAAYDSLHAANSLAPGDARITRAIARLLSERGDPQALTFLEMLTESPDGTPQDRADLIRLALRVGQLAAAQKHLLALLSDPQSAHRFDVLLLAAEWHGRCGDHSRAVAISRQALAAARDDAQTAEAKLQLVRLLLQSPSQIAEAKQFLRELADREDRAGLEALLLLSEVCKTQPAPEEARQLSERLGHHPLATDEQRLLGLTWKLRYEPDHRAQILADAISTFRDGGPARLAALGRWLIQEQESACVVALIPLAAARENQELFLIYVDALAELGRWPELQTLLAGAAPLPLDPSIRHLYQVRTALAMGREEESRQHWLEVRQSLRQAEPKTVLYVAQYAERLGQREDAAKAYRLLTGMAGAERAGYLGLILITEQSGDTHALRDQVKEFAGRFPTEFEPQNDAAYLDLLLNENVAPALESAAPRVQRFPEILAYRTTLALAHLRNGDAAAARAVYREIETDWVTAKPGWRAVYAAVLAASGDAALAQAHASAIDIGQLRAEERSLIAGLGQLSAR